MLVKESKSLAPRVPVGEGGAGRHAGVRDSRPVPGEGGAEGTGGKGSPPTLRHRLRILRSFLGKLAAHGLPSRPRFWVLRYDGEGGCLAFTKMQRTLRVREGVPSSPSGPDGKKPSGDAPTPACLLSPWRRPQGSQKRLGEGRATAGPELAWGPELKGHQKHSVIKISGILMQC